VLAIRAATSSPYATTVHPLPQILLNDQARLRSPGAQGMEGFLIGIRFCSAAARPKHGGRGAVEGGRADGSVADAVEQKPPQR
jgi:hypothetical protein